MDNMFIPASLIQTLQTIPWFLELKPRQLEQLASIARFRTLKADEILFHEGDREDLLYIVMEGQIALEVFVPSQGLVRTYTAETLDVIGWSSMTPIVRQRTATAQAITNCSVLLFNGEWLRNLCDQDHDLGYIIMRRLANVVASRFLSTRLTLFDLLVNVSRETADQR
jgi:CRP/FNR family cyclic AMP-dependent transcriptional regulator